jgi:HK97 family phage portal protein
MLLWGNFYAYISRNAFWEPTGLYPLAPWDVTPKVENGRKVFYINGKRYSNNQIYHVYALSMNGVEGLRPIRMTSQTIGLNLAAEKMQSSAFGKGLHASGVITMPEEQKDIMGSTDEEADQYMESLRKSFKKIYQNGPDSWHEMMFLEPGWNFEQFKLNLETAQIIETRKMGVADVARLLGVPLHKLMQLDKSTSANIEQQGIEYVQDAVLPLTVNFEQEDKAKLLKENEKESRFFKYNLGGLMRADIKSRYEAYSTALGKNAPGFMTPEEIRDREDLGSIEEDELFKPDNMNKQTFEPNKDAA